MADVEAWGARSSPHVGLADNNSDGRAIRFEFSAALSSACHRPNLENVLAAKVRERSLVAQSVDPGAVDLDPSVTA